MAVLKGGDQRTEKHCLATSWPKAECDSGSTTEAPKLRFHYVSTDELVPDENRRPCGLYNAIEDTARFYCTLIFFICGGSFKNCPFFLESPQAKVQLFSLYVVLWMWNCPHYRCGTFQEDMLANLRNVAIPGTGVALSLVVSSRFIAILFLCIGYPIVCMFAGIVKGRFDIQRVTQCYSEQLLCPQDWFSYWRLNCVLASFHAMVNKAKGFAQEDKWTFLTSAKEAGLPISPWLDCESIVVKNKNEEGGMGIHFYQNAAHGGNWIIQTRLTNDAFVRSLLPVKCPLSTLRVITASRGGLRQGSTSGPMAPLVGAPLRADVTSLSCVFRAGRAHALTDHNSILFDVDMQTGEILKGTSNMHWYQIGLHKNAATPWICLDHTITAHPDTGKQVTGHIIPNIDAIRQLCEDAHFRLMPDVPLGGWDVALTEEAGICLLEVNISCNFFRGTFNQRAYFDFASQYFTFIDEARRVS